MSEKHTYTVLDQQDNFVEQVSINGVDADDCNEQLDKYLSTKQGCYAYEHDSDEEGEDSHD